MKAHLRLAALFGALSLAVAFSLLASLLVARLHAEGVPVAGLDRLRLSAPLGVQDLLAAARFAVQPLDDLNLANLLVSPLFGWSQEELYEAAFGRDREPLWPRLRALRPADDETMAGLRAILDMADYATPYLFLETLLSGPLQGRRKLLDRLGQEARDPIEELLSAAQELWRALPDIEEEGERAATRRSVFALVHLADIVAVTPGA
jgi:ATP-dependent helicase/nuclease subunit A